MKRLMLTIAFIPLLAACWGKKDEPKLEQPSATEEVASSESEQHPYKEILAEESDDNVDEK